MATTITTTTTTTIAADKFASAFREQLPSDDPESVDPLVALARELFVLHVPKGMAMQTGTLIAPKASSRKMSAWQAFLKSQAEQNTEDYRNASNKTTYCSVLYKEQLPTKEARAAFLADWQSKHGGSVPVAGGVSSGERKKAVSAWNQFQREFPEEYRAAHGLGANDKLPSDYMAAKSEAWKARKGDPEAVAALKARCVSHNNGQGVPIA